MGLHPPERVREYRKRGWWTGDTVDELLRARVAERGDVPALVDPLNREVLVGGDPRTLTWNGIDDQVDRLAQVLLDEGIGAGDVVAVQLPNTVEIVVAFLAVVRIGAVVCPFPVQYRAHEITVLSTVAEAVAVVTTGRIGERPAAAEVAALRGAIPSLRSVLAFGPDVPPGAVPLEERIAAADDRRGLAAHVAARRTDPGDCVTICWTSGTESAPKGVPRTHYDWLAMAVTTAEAPGLSADDVLLNPFPMVNMAGISGMFLPWLRVGGLLVQHHPFDLPTFLRQIAVHRPTYTVAPPALLTVLLHDEEVARAADLSSLRCIGSGSAPLAPSLLQGFSERYGIEVLNFYGSNEGVGLFAGPTDVPDPAERARSFPRYGVPGRHWSFRMADWTTTRVVDPATGEEITEPGRPGELRIKGPGVFPGYLPASGVPDPFDEDGFLCSGDLVEIAGDEGQYLRYVDRIKDVVVRGGMKISAAEVEGYVAGHPGVAEVAVVAVPDDVLGERACAVVVLRPGADVTLEDVVAHLRRLAIATFKLPERLVVVDALPRNPLGKVLKRELRDRLAPN
ncbi:MAG: class I adenylate-forming enzyme family protein [Mycobacteriales bacterium]